MKCKGKVTGATWSLFATVIIVSGTAESQKDPGSLQVSLTTMLVVDSLLSGLRVVWSKETSSLFKSLSAVVPVILSACITDAREKN